MLRTPIMYGLGSLVSFEESFAIVSKNEGGYANNPVDRGGETYRGIARNFHPNWEGWVIVDFIKSRFGPIPSNRLITQISLQNSVIDTHMVPDFYANLWNKSRSGEISNQKLANLYFDFFIHSGEAVRVVQRTLNSMGANLAEDNRIGPKTLAAINAENPEKLHDAIKRNRTGYIESLAQNGLLDQSLLEPLKKRVAKFPSLTSDPSTNKLLMGVGLLAGAAALYLISVNITQRIENKDYETA